MYEEVIIGGKKYIAVDIYAYHKKMMLMAAEELAKTLSGEDLIIFRDVVDTSSLTTIVSFVAAYTQKFFILCLNDNGTSVDHGSTEFEIKVAKAVLLDFLQKEKEK